MSVLIGIIAEDKSDVDALYEFACKIGEENSFKFKKFIGHGCGKLRRKCCAWAHNLRARGCEYLIVAHDLDDRLMSELRADLESRVCGVGFPEHLILIPVRELEAWLLCDQSALKKVFGTSTLPKVPGQPESIVDPKRALRNTIKKAGGGTYLNTIHNSRIAREARIDTISRRCSSFKPYVEFMTRLLQ